MTEESKSSLALAVRLFLDEGPRALWNRALDRREEKIRLRRLPRLREDHGRLSGAIGSPPVLNVSSLPPSPKRGGAQIQMLDRLAEEKKLRTVALAYPRDGFWWLEVSGPTVAGIVAIGDEGTTADLVQRAANLVGTSVVHIESLAGLPLDLIGELEDRKLTTVLSIHDFTLFCRRPHLIETSTTEFCGYCQDSDRCDECLRDLDLDPFPTQEAYRRAGAEALRSASTVIYPSKFLQRQYRVLFPDHRGQTRENVIAPASSRSTSSKCKATRRMRVGFVGGAYTHKGGALIAPTIERVRTQLPDAGAFVYGNGERVHFRRLRNSLGIRVRGYYRPGMLASLLLRDQISIAVFPSIWPEAYALVVDECLSVGVPVVAFDHGAVADRLRAWKVGDLVPLRESASGLAESVVSCLASDLGVPDTVISDLPLPESSAKQHVDLYRSLIALAGRSDR